MTDFAALRQRAQRLVAGARGERVLLGIAGPPGAGKSTLATALVAALSDAALVPMDGFHLAQAELIRLGRAAHKGAPDTFDADGYLALLGRLRRRQSLTCAPAFDRRLDEPVADSIAVPYEVTLVITEGNYLLLPEPPWGGVRRLLDACWYVDLDEGERHRRLVDRHVRHGRTPEQAERWVHQVDELNAARVAAARSSADLVTTAVDGAADAG